jgi:hypothetical protein
MPVLGQFMLGFISASLESQSSPSKLRRSPASHCIFELSLIGGILGLQNAGRFVRRGNDPVLRKRSRFIPASHDEGRSLHEQLILHDDLPGKTLLDGFHAHRHSFSRINLPVVQVGQDILYRGYAVVLNRSRAESAIDRP